MLTEAFFFLNHFFHAVDFKLTCFLLRKAVPFLVGVVFVFVCFFSWEAAAGLSRDKGPK